MPVVPAVEYTLIQLVPLSLRLYIATLINLGKLAALVKVLGCALDHYSDKLSLHYSTL